MKQILAGIEMNFRSKRQNILIELVMKSIRSLCIERYLEDICLAVVCKGNLYQLNKK